MLYKSNLLTLVTMVDSWYIDEYCYWAQVDVLLMYLDIGLLGQVIYRLCTTGRAPCIKETLPDFRERCWVTRHS